MRLREGGEADRVRVEGERGVDVLHEAVAEQPDVAAEAEVLASDRTNALAAANRAEVEAEGDEMQSVSYRGTSCRLNRYSLSRRDGPSLATPAEANSRERVARVRVVALGGVVHLRAGDGGVEGLDGGGRAVDDGGAGVNDGLESRDGGLGASNGLSASCLPEAGRAVDAVVLDRATVLRGVGSAEEERGT